MPAFRPAVPARMAAAFASDAVHVWRLPYRADQRRIPFRALVATYLGIDADAVVFRDAPGGRPSIASPDTDLCVNWSHSGSHAVIALARSLPLFGVDFEIARPRPRAGALARRFFHGEEYAELSTRSGGDLEKTFLQMWTAKEAVLKALGEGLRFGLDRVVFRMQGDALVPDRFADTAGSPADWSLQRLDDPVGYACVAWRGPHRLVEWLSCDQPDDELFSSTPV